MSCEFCERINYRKIAAKVDVTGAYLQFSETEFPEDVCIRYCPVCSAPFVARVDFEVDDTPFVEEQTSTFDELVGKTITVTGRVGVPFLNKRIVTIKSRDEENIYFTDNTHLIIADFKKEWDIETNQ